LSHDFVGFEKYVDFTVFESEIFGVKNEPWQLNLQCLSNSSPKPSTIVDSCKLVKDTSESNEIVVHAGKQLHWIKLWENNFSLAVYMHSSKAVSVPQVSKPLYPEIQRHSNISQSMQFKQFSITFNKKW
jgi:hypothetical protein